MSTVSTERPDDADAPAGAPVIELRGITKRFPGVVANRDINLARAARRGARHRRRERRRQVDADEDPLRHAPAGRGHDPASTAGRWSFRTPTDAIAAGIGMVHQHFMLADNFTVLENVILGSEPERGGRLDFEAARAQGAARSPTATASASTPTAWSRTSASATGSGSRSSRCSTAAPAS